VQSLYIHKLIASPYWREGCNASEQDMHNVYDAATISHLFLKSLDNSYILTLLYITLNYWLAAWYSG